MKIQLIAISFLAFSFPSPFLLKANTSYPDSGAQVRRQWRNTSHLKKHKKVAVGIGAAGIYGRFGGSVELNLNPQTAFQLGFGTAPSFQSFQTQIKQSFSGAQFSPYLVGGYSLWFDNNSSIDLNTTYPAFLGERFLTEEEISSGHFRKHILFSGLGLQYFQTKDPLAGLSIYVEFDLFISLNQFVSATTGGLGLMYYF